MHSEMWDSLFNIALLLFWNRIWIADERDVRINRYLSTFARIQTHCVSFLQPVLPFLGPRGIASVAFAVLVVFRALAVPDGANWELGFGLIVGRTQGGALTSCLIFSVLSFALFLFKLWGISLIFVRTQETAGYRASTDSLYQLSRPFSGFDSILRSIVLLILGTVLAYLLTGLGAPALPPTALPAQGLRMILLALAGWVAVLPIVQQVLFLVLIGSLVANFMGAPSLNAFCRDWIDTLLGPMRQYPIRVGMIDLTPLVFLFGLGWVYFLLTNLLQTALTALS